MPSNRKSKKEPSIQLENRTICGVETCWWTWEAQLYTADHGLRVVLEAWRRLLLHTPPDRIVLQMRVSVEARLGPAGVERLVADCANGLSVQAGRA